MGSYISVCCNTCLSLKIKFVFAFYWLVGDERDGRNGKGAHDWLVLFFLVCCLMF